MRDFECCINAVSTSEKSGLARVFSVDRGYLADVGGLVRIVVCGWGIELYGQMPRDGLR